MTARAHPTWTAPSVRRRSPTEGRHRERRRSQHGARPPGPAGPGRPGGDRPRGAAQARRAADLRGLEERRSARPRRRTHLQRRHQAGQAGAAGHAVGAASCSTSSPTTSRRCSRRPSATSAPRSCGRSPRTPTRRLPGAGRRCWPRPTSWAPRMLGVPEELGGVMTERSAVTSVLVAEKLGPRRHGPGRRDPGARRREHGDLPVGRRRPAGQVPAALHRGRRARRRAGHPGAARCCSTRWSWTPWPSARPRASRSRHQVAGAARCRRRAVRGGRR